MALKMQIDLSFSQSGTDTSHWRKRQSGCTTSVLTLVTSCSRPDQEFVHDHCPPLELSRDPSGEVLCGHAQGSATLQAVRVRQFRMSLNTRANHCQQEVVLSRTSALPGFELSVPTPLTSYVDLCSTHQRNTKFVSVIVSWSWVRCARRPPSGQDLVQLKRRYASFATIAARNRNTAFSREQATACW